MESISGQKPKTFIVNFLKKLQLDEKIHCKHNNQRDELECCQSKIKEVIEWWRTGSNFIVVLQSENGQCRAELKMSTQNF